MEFDKEQFKENPQVINAFIAQNNDMTYKIGQSLSATKSGDLYA